MENIEYHHGCLGGGGREGKVGTSEEEFIDAGRMGSAGKAWAFSRIVSSTAELAMCCVYVRVQP